MAGSRQRTRQRDNVDWGYRLLSGESCVQRGKLDLLTLDKAPRYMLKPMPYLTKQGWGLKPLLTTLNLVYSLKNNEHLLGFER